MVVDASGAEDEDEELEVRVLEVGATEALEEVGSALEADVVVVGASVVVVGTGLAEKVDQRMARARGGCLGIQGGTHASVVVDAVVGASVVVVGAAVVVAAASVVVGARTKDADVAVSS